MKPLVEGIGLNWKTQRTKLAASHFAAQAIKIAVLTTTGNRRPMICIPLRKLLGWLMTICSDNMPSTLQQSVHAYQHKCDDVLWQHWLMGQPQYKQNAISDEGLDDLSDACVGTVRKALASGDAVPLLDAITERQLATSLAKRLLSDNRWLVTFHPNGEPQLICLPPEAGVFTPAKMLSWIKEHDGAFLSFMPELLHAVADRIRMTDEGLQ